MYRNHLLNFLLLFDIIFAFAQRCVDEDLRHCMRELKVLTGSEDLAFAMTETELNMSCGHLRDAMNCVNNFTNRCLDSSHREVYRTLTSGAQELILELCTPDSPFRKEYLVHAPCFKGLKAEYKDCTDDYSRSQESLKYKKLSSDMKLRKSCCFFDAYQECTRTAVLAKCSPEAAEVGTQIVTKAGGPLVQAYCAGYRHSSPDCMGTDSTAASYSFHTTLYLVTVLLLITSWRYAM